jgi:DUF4097 and DUF4098 domain-containing protein YvlB
MQKTFEVTGPVELDVRLASGEIEVDANLDSRVEIELVAHDEESQRLVDEARVELLDRPGRPVVVIDIPQKKGFSFGLSFGRSGVHCRVRCPHESGLQAKSKSADLQVRGTLAGLAVTTASGDIEVDDVTGGVSIKGASADFTARTVGALNVQTASGDVEVGTASGPVNVNTASGDVSIGSADDNLSVNTVSGDQSLEAVRAGHVSAQSVSGDVSIGVRRGSRVYLDCSTVSGDTSSELDLQSDAPAGEGPLVEVRARTVSGDIEIRRAPAPMTDSQEVHA